MEVKENYLAARSAEAIRQRQEADRKPAPVVEQDRLTKEKDDLARYRLKKKRQAGTILNICS